MQTAVYPLDVHIHHYSYSDWPLFLNEYSLPEKSPPEVFLSSEQRDGVDDKEQHWIAHSHPLEAADRVDEERESNIDLNRKGSLFFHSPTEKMERNRTWKTTFYLRAKRRVSFFSGKKGKDRKIKLWGWSVEISQNYYIASFYHYYLLSKHQEVSPLPQLEQNAHNNQVYPNLNHFLQPACYQSTQHKTHFPFINWKLMLLNSHFYLLEVPFLVRTSEIAPFTS